MSSGTSVNMLDDLVDDVVAEVGAFRACHREAFGEVVAAERGDVGAAEHARLPSGQHHESGDGVDEQLVPRRGDEVGIDVDRKAAGRAASPRAAPRRAPRAAPAAPACAGEPSPAARVSAENHTTQGTHRRLRAVAARPVRPVRRRSAGRTPRCSRRTAGPATAATAAFWVSLTASSTTSTGAVDVGGIGVHRARHARWESPSSGLSSMRLAAACGRTASPGDRRRGRSAAIVEPMAPGPTSAMRRGLGQPLRRSFSHTGQITGGPAPLD